MNDALLSGALALCLGGATIDLVALNVVALPAVRAPLRTERAQPARAPAPGHASATPRARNLPHVPIGNELATRAESQPVAILEFEVSSRRVDRHAARALLQTVAELRAASEITVIGHADASGASDLNDRLSAQRAAAVAQRLIESGIPKARVRLTARGEHEPRQDGNSRRVEIFVGGQP